MPNALFHYYWWGRGWAREGRLWLARALEQDSTPNAVRAKALLTDAALALADGDFDAGRRRLADAEAIAESTPDPVVLGYCKWNAGTTALFRGDLPAALDLFEQGLAVTDPDRDLTVRGPTIPRGWHCRASRDRPTAPSMGDVAGDGPGREGPTAPRPAAAGTAD